MGLSHITDNWIPIGVLSSIILDPGVYNIYAKMISRDSTETGKTFVDGSLMTIEIVDVWILKFFKHYLIHFIDIVV